MKLDTIRNRDCIEGMKDIASDSVDLVITDPPFGIGFGGKKKNYNRRDELVIKGYQEISDGYALFSMDWIGEIKRVLKYSGQAFIFSGYNHILDIAVAIKSHGFEMLGMPAWEFPFGVYCEKRWVNSHYNIFNICKNPKKTTFNSDCRFTSSKERYHDLEDVFHITRNYRTGMKKTPTTLPLELILKIMQYTTNHGDVVLDPFMGGGTTALAAKILKRRYLGFEIVPEYCEFIKTRLRNSVKVMS